MTGPPLHRITGSILEGTFSSQAPRALLSVFDKTGIVEFAQSLVKLGFEILSTGGTARMLRQSEIEVIDVSAVTNHPECFDGRVKSLHPAIHAPLLARLEMADDRKGLEELGYSPIQVVAVNLYAFADAAAKTPPLPDSELLEMVDIGGPTLIRAAAKNHQHVIIASSPNSYDSIISQLSHAGPAEKVDIEFRRKLALQAFEHTADYDAAIANELHKRWVGDAAIPDDVELQAQMLPNQLLISASQSHLLRYGENSHQAAALYIEPKSLSPSAPTTLVSAIVEGGKEMSYNNYADADSCLRLCRALSTDEWPQTPHACVIVKHNNPCGAALGSSQLEAYEAALASDPESAFGSIICFNKTVGMEVALALKPLFLEVLMAPAYDNNAKSVIMEKKNRRILTIPSPDDLLESLPRQVVKKPIEGGWLVQTEEPPVINWSKAKVVTDIEPTEEQIASMKFGVRICEQVKSNAIIMVKGTRTIGIGPGQTSRVEAVNIAARRAGDEAQGCVLVSDAFFPFKDGIERAAAAGAVSIVQPGGSIRDQEVIDEANARGMSMLFTGHRLFRH